MSAIAIRDLRKTFGTFEVLQGISLDVRPGELYGFLLEYDRGTMSARDYAEKYGFNSPPSIYDKEALAETKQYQEQIRRVYQHHLDRMLPTEFD